MKERTLYLWFLGLELSVFGVSLSDLLHGLRSGGQRLHGVIEETVNLIHVLVDGVPQGGQEGIKETLDQAVDVDFTGVVETVMQSTLIWLLGKRN